MEGTNKINSNPLCDTKLKRLKEQGGDFSMNKSLNCETNTAAEAAVSIDHILWLILEPLDQKELMTVRFVSTHWNNCAAKQLQKQTEHSFTLHICDATRNRDPHSYFQRAPCHFLKPPDVLDLLSKLTALIQNQSLSSEFPCTSFTFFDASNLNLAGDFLNAFGLKIKKLTLVDYSIHFEDLKILLLKQTPNLEYLVLDCSIVFKTPLKNSTDDVICKLNPANKLNLRIFKVKKNIPENILLEILQCSPKFKQVEIDQSEYLHLLVQPVNRLDLLKTATIHISANILNSLEILGSHHSGNWVLKTLFFYNEGLFYSETCGRALLNVIRNFVEGVSVSLKCLFWSDLNSLVGLQLVVMPKVERVEFQRIHPVFSNLRDLNRTKINLGTTFPNMKTLIIQLKSSPFPRRPIQFCFSQFFSDMTPVYSVIEFYLGGMQYDPSLLDMFPNAVFSSDKD